LTSPLSIYIFIVMKKSLLIIVLLFLLFSCKKEKTPEPKIKIYFIGDSHCYNYYRMFPHKYAELLNAYYRISAFPGRQAKDYLSMDTINKVTSFAPDIILIRLGTNDIINNNGFYNFQYYKTLLALLKKSNPDAKFLLASVTNTPGIYMNEEKNFNNELKALPGTTYIDLYNHSDYRYISADNEHFSPNGYFQQAEYTYSVFDGSSVHIK
jgi:hypothetical protein